MIVGARRRRSEVGARVKLHVVIYRTEQGTHHWAFTLTDDHQTAIARSSSTRLDDLGMKWELLVAALHLLLDVRIAEAGTRLVRDDDRWDVAVRLVDGRDELPFRVS